MAWKGSVALLALAACSGAADYVGPGPETADGSSAGGAAGGSTAGGSAGGTAAPVDAGSPCPSSAFFCDGFENATAGSQAPAPWSNNNAVNVTGAMAYRGTHALDIPGGQFLSFNLSPPRDVVFIRMMLFSNFQGSTPDSRFGIVSAQTQGESYVASTEAAAQLVAFYHYPNGEAAIDSMVAMPHATWTCLEVSYDRTTRIIGLG